MADDIIDIEDYEVKDKEIVEASDEDDYQGEYNQREYGQSEYDQGKYGSEGGFSGYYKSISLDNTSLLIILMVAIVLIAIFIMTFD